MTNKDKKFTLLLSNLNNKNTMRMQKNDQDV